MPPKENPERACEECIHFFACSRQCGEPMAQSSATGCECYEPIKSSMAYYVGTLNGAKGTIPNRLRELAEADELVSHALHPYTRSLLSAIPMPDPRREREKKLLVYDPAMHDYSTEAPQWRELRPEHFVLCSKTEAEQWAKG